ncbi:meiotic recombination protein SPO11 isoform X7 [Zea mays]|uniref:meiotic recombination protein SPO11 isoform X7 n=1 Tax=Zea mays TaxID=4577 RepID=UPI0004DEC4ED|nr:meiotic recombination protein SPO11 isoform X7 [Zea mays]|eukprot:XP_008643458.1 meiotic recombination protein SPO11 isoform X7 [Zea mays]
MAGRDKRRRAAPLEGDEQQLRRRLEEAALLLRRIKGLVRWIVEEVAAGRSPSIVLHRYRNYCSSADSASPSPWFSFRARSRDHLLPDQFTVTSLEQFSPKCVTSVDPGRALVRDCSACSYDIPVGTDVLSLLHKDYHTSRLNVLLRVLFVVQQLLQQNKHCSKRDIYYMYPSIFVEVAVVDRAINDICILFKCSRHNLNVVPVVKGLVMGWIRFMEGEKKVYCITSVNAAFSIPVDIEAIKDVVSVAHYILVVEKETVFQRLANDKFCERNRCIVITQLAHDANLLRVPDIRWLGVFTSDFEEYCLPDCCLLRLSPEDRRKAEGILARCYLHREAPEWRSELEAMLQKGVKFEIEALSANSISFLSHEYIPQKIKQAASNYCSRPFLEQAA